MQETITSQIYESLTKMCTGGGEYLMCSVQQGHCLSVLSEMNVFKANTAPTTLNVRSKSRTPHLPARVRLPNSRDTGVG